MSDENFEVADPMDSLSGPEKLSAGQSSDPRGNNVRGKIHEYPLGIDVGDEHQAASFGITRLSRVIPEGQLLFSLPPDASVAHVLSEMRKRKISQVPILAQNGHVLGVFSYRSFAQQLAGMTPPPSDPVSMSVIEFLEDMPFAHGSDDVAEKIRQLDEFDAVLIGDRERITAIVTVVDALKFFYGIASPFVLMAEIEVLIRHLMAAVTTPASLKECIAKAKSIGATPAHKKMPDSLSEMTFHQYLILIQANPDQFRRAFGLDNAYTESRIERLKHLRNALFHLKRPITDEDYDRLRTERSWLRTRGEYLASLSGNGSNDAP